MLQWALIVTLLVSVAAVFNPSGASRVQPSFRTENQVWMFRFKLVSCCFTLNFSIPF